MDRSALALLGCTGVFVLGTVGALVGGAAMALRAYHANVAETEPEYVAEAPAPRAAPVDAGATARPLSRTPGKAASGTPTATALPAGTPPRGVRLPDGSPAGPVVDLDAGAPSSPAPAADASAPAGSGTLSMSSVPPSFVVLDGRPLGRSPQSLAVPAGVHTVKFVTGAQTKLVMVTVAPGEAQTVAVKLAPSTP